MPRPSSGAEMPRRRLGVALLLPEPLRTEVRALRRALGSPSVDMQPPHITLVAPVNVREEQVAEAVGVLRSAAATVGRLRLRLGPIDTFAPVSPVLFLGVHGVDVNALRSLVPLLRVGPLLRDVDRAYVPHCTLHESADDARIGSAILSLNQFRAVCEIDRIDLLEQHDDRVWRTLTDVALAAPVVRGRGGIEVALRTSEQPAPDVRSLLDMSVIETDGPPVPQWWIEGREPAGSVVGAATGFVDAANRELHLSTLAVAPVHRRSGIGDRLLGETIEFARGQRCSFVSLHVFADDWQRGWYARRGFVVDLELARWLRGRDVVQMIFRIS